MDQDHKGHRDGDLWLTVADGCTATLWSQAVDVEMVEVADLRGPGAQGMALASSQGSQGHQSFKTISHSLRSWQVPPTQEGRC